MTPVPRKRPRNWGAAGSCDLRHELICALNQKVGGPMKHRAILAIALGAIALLAWSGATRAGERRASIATYAAPSEYAKARYYRKRRPLEITIYGRRRIGGYSYRGADVVSTYGQSPPPWLDVRQTPGGPFDSGFFFDSGMGLHGGNSPYQH